MRDVISYPLGYGELEVLQFYNRLPDDCCSVCTYKITALECPKAKVLTVGSIIALLFVCEISWVILTYVVTKCSLPNKIRLNLPLEQQNLTSEQQNLTSEQQNLTSEQQNLTSEQQNLTSEQQN